MRLNVYIKQLKNAIQCLKPNCLLTRMMFIKHYAPNRCLCIKVANSIHWVEDCRDVTKAGGGGYVQRMEVIMKRNKSQGGGQGRCERRSEAFVKIQKKKKKNLGGGGGRVEGGSG